MSDSAPETATELFHFNSRELSYCMLVWMRFAKEADLEALMRGKWNDCIKAARQDRLLLILETCLQQEGTKHKCRARDDFQRLHCRKSCAAAIFVTDVMMSDSLRADPASVILRASRSGSRTLLRIGSRMAKGHRLSFSDPTCSCGSTSSMELAS